jgi:hypothetical protein
MSTVIDPTDETSDGAVAFASERVADHLRPDDPRTTGCCRGSAFRQDAVAEELGASRLPCAKRCGSSRPRVSPSEGQQRRAGLASGLRRMRGDLQAARTGRAAGARGEHPEPLGRHDRRTGPPPGPASRPATDLATFLSLDTQAPSPDLQRMPHRPSSTTWCSVSGTRPSTTARAFVRLRGWPNNMELNTADHVHPDRRDPGAATSRTRNRCSPPTSVAPARSSRTTRSLRHRSRGRRDDDRRRRDEMVERGGGSPLLLIQGLGYPADMWFRLVPELAAHHRVITFDNRGIGRNARGGRDRADDRGMAA